MNESETETFDYLGWLKTQAEKCEKAGRHYQDNQGCCHNCGVVLDPVLAAENGIEVDDVLE